MTHQRTRRWASSMVAWVALMVCCCNPVPGSSEPPSRNVCLPEPLHVVPQQIDAGSTVSLSSAPFTCGAVYPVGKTYQVTLGLVGRASSVNLGNYPVTTDGSFQASVTIPSSASPGEAYLIVHGSPFDQCAASPGLSCASYEARIEILPPKRS